MNVTELELKSIEMMNCLWKFSRTTQKKTRTIQIFKENISLELMDEYIQTFKKEIPWNFIKNDKTD